MSKIHIDAQTIRRKIQRTWLQDAKRHGWDISGMSPRSFDKVLPHLSRNDRKEGMALGPWLPAYELSVQWLTNVSIVLSSGDDGVLPKDKALQVPWSLVGAAAHYSIAIRQLTILGFDSPARAQLRTLVEALLLCLATMEDPDLSNSFHSAHTDAEVKTFWHKSASPKNLHLRIQALERDYGLPDDWIESFSDWRTEEHSVFSQAVHLSFVASVTTILSQDLGESEEARYGVLGHRTSQSERTLSFGARTIWYFCILGGGYLFDRIGQREPIFPLDEDNPVHQSLMVTRRTLMQVVKEVWEATDAT